MCPSGMCAHQGTCLPPQDIPPAGKNPYRGEICTMETGGTCRVQDCYKSRNAVCSDTTFGFSSGVSLGRCICGQIGTCAVNGKCVPSPAATAPPAKLEAKHIVCPVLASLYNAGFLKPDSYGRVERLKIQEAIREGLNADDTTAWFFGQTTAGYTEADVDEQNFMMAPVDLSLKLKAEGATEEPTPADRRFLNIFTMASNPDILHQVGAAVRGGEGLVDARCQKYPCASRFNDFFAKFATPEGRIYVKQLGEAACNIYRNGFHGVAADKTFFTQTQGLTGREFLALSGWIVAFGHKDEQGDLYLTVEDTRTMEMHGVFPKDWKKPAQWGSSDVMKVQNAWRKQGICGLSEQIKTLTLMNALAQGTTAAIAKVFRI